MTSRMNQMLGSYYDQSYEMQGYRFFADGEKIYQSCGIGAPKACVEFVESIRPESTTEAITAIIFFREKGRIPLPTGNTRTDATIKKIKDLILSKKVTPNW